MKQYDEELIVRLLQDKQTKSRAFEQIVAQYSKQLYWNIRRMVLSHDDANDILQNVFLKAWQNIDSFRADSRLSTWLYRICVNETLTFVNRQQNNVELDSADDYISQTLESDEYFDGNEVQLHLQKAISSLPEKQKIVFNMKYYEEKKYEEMSEILNTSVGALKASYHIAVEKIKAFFQEND